MEVHGGSRRLTSSAQSVALRRIPSVITGIRLSLVPLLVYLVLTGMLAYGALLFILMLGTDLADGYLARSLGQSSALGSYFDVTTDFILVLSMFLVFDSEGFVPFWVVEMITSFFVLFIVTSVVFGRIYDPIGKYYGSLLYGAIGLRFLASGEFVSELATVVITGYTAVSLSTRIYHLWLSTRTFHTRPMSMEEATAHPRIHRALPGHSKISKKEPG
ncbi:MAG TPA: CDP-alcohol phosphatidyltransferase family protein [Nitrososphaerales archaeon]|nr:CDP-alcohol phosphatidyltransferase family protein [Nitrososphaerales archaeon]